MNTPMQRRDFITLLGTSAVAWPLVAGAQQDGRVRRIGVLTVGVDGPVTQANFAALREGLDRLGWVEGRNLRTELRFGNGDGDRLGALAAELVNLAPDVIICASAAATRALQQRTQTIPLVITGVGDPVRNGIVKNIARPEGNTTGVTNLYASLGGKWLELIKEAVPSLQRIGLIYNERIGPFRMQIVRIPYRDAFEIVRRVDEFAAVVGGV